MTRKRRPSFEQRAVEQLSSSLLPNLHAAPALNAAFISFMNPGMGFGQALKAAEAIDELRKLTTRPPKRRKRG